MTANNGVEVLVIGGGPAGLAAAIWCSDLGLDCAVLESTAKLGGQLPSVFGAIENYPGARFSNGRELQMNLETEIRRRQIRTLLETPVSRIDKEQRIAYLLHDKKPIAWRNLILATGVRRRELGVPGEIDFRGRGIIASGVGESERVNGKTIAIIGGGDAALENALLLSDKAEHIYLIHRRSEFSARKNFVEGIKAQARIEPMTGMVVRAFHGSNELASIDVAGPEGTVRNISIDLALIRIGVAPNSELLQDIAERDDAGYLVVDQYGRTDSPNIFAVGDVAFRHSPTIATAVGSAATVVKLIHNLRSTNAA